MNVDLNIKSNTKTKRGEVAMDAVVDNTNNVIMNNNVKLLYSVKETSEVLGVSKHCVYDLIIKGLLPVLKLGKHLRIKPANIGMFYPFRRIVRRIFFTCRTSPERRMTSFE